MKINTDKLNSVLEKRLETYADLAKKTGLTPASMSKIKTGKSEPRISTVKKIVEALDCTVDDITD